MTGRRRGLAARLGIAALNFLLPGLGLLRLGRGRIAATLIGLNVAALLVLTGWYAVGPVLTYLLWLGPTSAAVLIYLGTMLAAIVLSWRSSGELRPPERWWSRWYGVLGVWLVFVAVTLSAPDLRNYYRNFYVPSESMMPTFVVNDRFVAHMRDFGPLARGQILLVRTESGAIYVNRLAALPGDRIAMRAGVVSLDGVPVVQRPIGLERIEMRTGPAEVRRLSERFPGERRAHEIYDLGPTGADDFPEIVVRPGHVFLLGDNRDMSADSRVAREAMGLEQVPISDVVGRPLFFSWWPGQRNRGQPIAD